MWYPNIQNSNCINMRWECSKKTRFQSMDLFWINDSRHTQHSQPNLLGRSAAFFSCECLRLGTGKNNGQNVAFAFVFLSFAKMQFCWGFYLKWDGLFVKGHLLQAWACFSCLKVVRLETQRVRMTFHYLAWMAASRSRKLDMRTMPWRNRSRHHHLSYPRPCLID